MPLQIYSKTTREYSHCRFLAFSSNSGSFLIFIISWRLAIDSFLLDLVAGKGNPMLTYFGSPVNVVSKLHKEPTLQTKYKQFNFNKREKSQ